MTQSQLDRIEDDVREIKHWITGNGEPERGLLMRMDRVEQDRRRQAWWGRTVGGAAVAALVAAAWSAIKGSA